MAALSHLTFILLFDVFNRIRCTKIQSLRVVAPGGVWTITAIILDIVSPPRPCFFGDL